MSATANNRRREPGKSGNDALMLGAALTAIAAIAIVWVAVAVGSQLDGVNEGLPSDPFEIISGLFRGRVVWSTSATMIAAAAVAVIVLVALWLVWMRSLGRKNRSSVDHAARYMATPRDLAPMMRKQALKKSARLGVAENPGVPVGRLHLGKQMLYASFEDMMLLIAGPRVGKSTSLVIPAIMAAPGAVVTTSNKRDVLDATRDVRAAKGHVWVFDPQRVAFEDATWWWNPLSYVTDDTKAAKLATHFASGTRAMNAKTDAYFDGKGQELLSDLLLAAAAGNRPISDVLLWLTSVEDETPVELLHDNGYPANARAVRGIMNTADKARDGIYSTAQGMAVCLKSAATADWVNARPNDTRQQFVPETFVTSTQTLYSLSKEGAGTAGPLVTALTAATIEAAEEHAARSRGGRLATPLVAVLDEAANVCRWKDLPDLYSHYGSRGIPIMAVFQSWSQGVGVFGKEGMLKLWSAANVKLYAGGVAEDEFLRTLSELIGTYDKETTSASYNKGVRSTTSALRREKILEVADLTSMGRGRAIMLSSGARAALVDTVPWYSGPKEQVAAINASIAAHDASSGPANSAPVSPVVTVMPPREAQRSTDVDAALRGE
ncbi:TraM recognition domain-containing protein [Rathayibacter sp. VKM Ac-2929]|uniref:type IV secretory system conjugative DNA transfer family protein n=1 Tax=Rathayibacter sp. VKM Ac-2929 TaxID=2929480 RepID=UPI001FB3EF01|nr:TraM recognition domain-containing protein [Rathayibacter sp. VKM Ac-2929]MCJ1675459.1 TraM recognition domain-containing protein [Rathayibacter sp. VKM Ac-2929]